MKDLPIKLISCSKVRPNKWNPNVMTSSNYRKLLHGIKHLVDKEQSIPPIIIRRIKEAPDDSFKYEIIDGEHRHRAFKELGIKKIPSWILNVNDSEARILTTTFNYLRGEPNVNSYADLVLEVISNGYSLSSISQFLPEDENTLNDMICLVGEDVDMQSVVGSISKEDPVSISNTLNNGQDNDVFVTLSYKVPVGVADIFHAEMLRMKDYLKSKGCSKGLNFRALELITINSQQTPLHQITGEEPSNINSKE